MFKLMKRFMGGLCCAAFSLGLTVTATAQNAQAPNLLPTGNILFGAAYYDEYSPTDRLDADIKMMKAAHITVVRIGESTWGTMEPSEGKFDFTHIDRVLNAMDRAGIKVIVGTPTYAIPTWLAREHPDILAMTAEGQRIYGARQNMDITNIHFRQAAERVIRAMISHVKDHPCVIGYQIDNETKAYGVSGAQVQAGFVEKLKAQFLDLNKLNEAFGLNYWSNRINSWDDFPNVTGTINNSLANAFSLYQRDLVTDYLSWQAHLVRALKRPDQFVTQNFDMAWRGYSYGIQTEVNHFDAAKVLDVAGMDIYHPGQDKLTGTEIALGGDLARSLKHGQNYFVIETQAQGQPDWTPYPGQLRLQGFSHLASGANMVSYWHWTTTDNGAEVYWRGLLSQDYAPNPTYQEAVGLGADIERIGTHLVNLKKHNRVAIYVSNRAQTAFNFFKFGWNTTTTYNDIMRPFYDALYRLNVEADFIDPSTTDFSAYRLIIVPALYSASDDEIKRLNDFAKAGGHIVYTFKSGFSDENDKARSSAQPGLIAEAAGVSFSQYSLPVNVKIRSDSLTIPNGDEGARFWMEFLVPGTAKVLATYDHPVWGKYAAITRNAYGKGMVDYIGFMPSDSLIERIMADDVHEAGLDGPEQQAHYPVIMRGGTNQYGHHIHYIFNYSSVSQLIKSPFDEGIDMLINKTVSKGQDLALEPWGVVIIEGH